MPALVPIILGPILAFAPVAAFVTVVAFALLTGDASARPPECELGEIC